MGAVVNSHKAVRQRELIRHLNPLISGWANYYTRVCSKTVFNAVDHYLVYKLLAWTRRRHPKKSKAWRAEKYWREGWSFSDETHSTQAHRGRDKTAREGGRQEKCMVDPVVKTIGKHFLR